MAANLNRAVELAGGPAAFMARVEIKPRTFAEWLSRGVPDHAWAKVSEVAEHQVTPEALAVERATLLAKPPRPKRARRIAAPSEARS